MTSNYQTLRQYTSNFQFAFKKCKEAIYICDFSIIEENYSSGYIKAKTNTTWKSHGEDVELWIHDSSGVINLKSTSSVSTTFFDYGKNKENIEKLLKALENLLSDVDNNISIHNKTVVQHRASEDMSFKSEEISKDISSKSHERDQVFISYSHKDKDWLRKFQVMLNPAVRKQKITVWDDTMVKVGAKWRYQIENALAKAKLAVLMVSPSFLASDFIAEHELPPLLKAADNTGVTIIWVYLSDCMYELTEIENYQAAHDISRPLDSLSPSDLNSTIKEICKQILVEAGEIPQ